MANTTKKDEIRAELLEVLLANVRENGDPRSIELLGKLKTLDLFARPEPARQQDAQIDARTAERLAGMAQLFRGEAQITRDLGAKLLALAEQASEAARDKAKIDDYDLQQLKTAIDRKPPRKRKP